MKLAGICLTTHHVPALAAFYQQILGVQAEGDDRHVELNTEGAGIAIFSVEGTEEMAPNATEGIGYGGVTLMFEVKDLEWQYERLKNLEVDIIKPPESYPWGARSFWFKDPDGNIIDFFARLS